MNCTLKVARGLKYGWGQLRLLSHQHINWRDYNSSSWVEHPETGGLRNANVWESGRRFILQNAEEHQRRQQMIIEDSKRKWSRGRPGREVLAPGTYRHDFIYNAGDKRDWHKKRDRRRDYDPDREAKDYSRKRMYQRQKEVKRQAYELQKSRRGYNLPKPDDSRAEAHEWDATMRRGGDEAEMQYYHSGTGEEAKYWHSWQTCPSQRGSEDLEHGEDFTQSDGSRSGLRGPPKGYYNSRRTMHHLQVPSIRSPNYQTVVNRLVCKRKPMGMEKRFNHLMQKYAEDELLEDESAVEEEWSQADRRKRWVNARMERMVRPPGYHMTVTRVAGRRPAPVCSYSEQLTIPPPSGSHSPSNCRSCSSNSLCDLSWH